MIEPAVGPPSPSSVRWRKAADELSPDKSLSGVATNGKFLVGTIALIGTALSAFGLIPLTAFRQRPLLRVCSIVIVALALLAVTLALSYLVLRSKSVNLDNLAAVRKWYGDEFAKAGRLRLADLLLVTAVALGGLTGLGAAATSVRHYGVGLQVAGIGSATVLKVTAKVNGVAPSSLVEVVVTGYTDKTTATLVRAKSLANEEGGSVVEANLTKVDQYLRFRLELTVNEKRHVEMVLP